MPKWLATILHSSEYTHMILQIYDASLLVFHFLYPSCVIYLNIDAITVYLRKIDFIYHK